MISSAQLWTHLHWWEGREQAGWGEQDWQPGGAGACLVVVWRLCV